MTALVILAAGASTRLGQPKQNLVLNHKTLLQGTIQSALQSECRPIYVITGANADLITPTLEYENVSVIHNVDWHEGIASSIRMGIDKVKRHEEVDSVLILLCDQPFVDSKLINDMVRIHQESPKGIVACQYNNTIGVPVLFSKSLFAELLLLQGDEGAKKILKNHQQEVVIVPFEKGIIDIDTVDDYNHLINS